MLYALLLFASLGDPVWEVRENAQRTLGALVIRHPLAYREPVAKWHSQTDCPEVRFRAEAILKKIDRQRAVDYVPSSVPWWPICDAYPRTNPAVPFGLLDNRDRGTLSRCECPGNYSPYWDGYRMSTERHVRLLIANGASYEEADLLLERMFELERRCKGDCQHPEMWEKAVEAWTRWEGGYIRR